MYGEFSYIYDKLSFDIEYEKYAENIKKLSREYKIGKGLSKLYSRFLELNDSLHDDFKIYFIKVIVI